MAGQMFASPPMLPPAASTCQILTSLSTRTFLATAKAFSTAVAGRAGRKGVSVLVVPFKARRRIERLLGDARVEANWVDAPGADDIQKRDDERLLNHPSLLEPVSESDAAMARSLIDIHGAEQVAAAFVALHRAKQSAPEDLMPVPEERPAGNRDRNERKREPRERTEARPPRDRHAERTDFDKSVWINISVGRKSGADPKWLLPMLCKSGGLNRTQIGAIRIEDTHTRVELSADAAGPFFERVGPEGRLEKSISAWKEGEMPTHWASKADGNAAPKPAYKSDRPKKSAPSRKPRAEAERTEKPKKKPRPLPPSQIEDQPRDKAAKPTSKGKPTGKFKGKPKSRNFDPGADRPPRRNKPKHNKS